MNQTFGEPGAAGEGLATLAIAGRKVERQPGMTRFLNQLEAEGPAHRARSQEDRRQVLCSFAVAERAMLASLDAGAG
jgi:DNA-binding MarR family transcriptional regulator